ncbi:hypothetical protein OR1_02766 [Geobacter sp. OR-1]|uniref:hypothetical protein n=1 Tax=Geobacter sp. OR-1 TaxID=1266765 RepID=UPI000543D205|nr:hypothetical protein [Geobacter sp. OR-1]GAM10477.1 hypothetical protein OR1_02766 [Geobacter sp. OR-1]
MKAICIVDFEKRIKAVKAAEEALKAKKKAEEEAEKTRRKAAAKVRKPKESVVVETSEEDRERASVIKGGIENFPGEEQEKEVDDTKVGYEDCYGIWFHGRLIEVIRQIGIERFKVDLGKQMHVFIDREPKKIADGIHELTVYGHPCRLYKWMAQGFHRGLVVLQDDAEGNASAAVYQETRTWSWMLSDKEKKHLAFVSEGNPSREIGEE